MNKNLKLAGSVISSVISSLLYIGAVSVMLIAAQIIPIFLMLVAIIATISPILIMKLEFNKPIHIMWSSIIIAAISMWPLSQMVGYQGVIVPLLAIFATIISFIAYEDF